MAQQRQSGGGGFTLGQAKVWSIGLDFAYSVIGFGAFGLLLDWLIGTSPWLLVTGLLLGLVGGFYRFVKEGLAAIREEESRDGAGGRSGGGGAAEKPPRGDSPD